MSVEPCLGRGPIQTRLLRFLLKGRYSSNQASDTPFTGPRRKI